MKYTLLNILSTLLIWNMANFPKGIYEGVFINKKVVAVFNTTTNVLVGTIYENRYVKHTLLGIVNENNISGEINLQILGNKQFEGFIKGDSVYLSIDIDSQICTFKFSKVSNSMSINLDKVFGKDKQDTNLLGTWKLLYFKNSDGKIRRDHDTITLTNDGKAFYTGVNLTHGNTSDVHISWYIIKNEIKLFMESKGLGYEYNLGNYIIKNDTLTCDRGNNSIVKYVKKK